MRDAFWSLIFFERSRYTDDATDDVGVGEVYRF